MTPRKRTPEAAPATPGPDARFISKENLFSEHFLLNILPTLPDWQALGPATEKVRDALKPLLPRISVFEHLTELDLDREFFNPVFRALDHAAHIQVRTTSGDFPDYVFFESESEKAKAEAFLGTDRAAFYAPAVALGELKAWEVPLDGGGTSTLGALDPAHPTGQIYGYLLREKKRWGILTNGRKWRIYHYDGAWPRIGRYYEIDLPALAAHPDPRALQYFVYFFQRAAFIPDSSSKTPLDKVREGSVEYSQKLAGNLRDAAYQALQILANGFLRWHANGLKGDQETDRLQIHQNSLKLLYRLLFVFKAESVGLLPLHNPVYRSQRSLDALKRTIRKRRSDTTNPLLNDSDDLYRALSRLFSLIDTGSAALGSPDRLEVPPYNGGLFKQTDKGTIRANFLSSKAMGDADLGAAIDLLARHTGGAAADDEAGFVDYSSLESQQLGTLYEGLLEYKLGFAANEDHVAIGTDKEGVQKWVPASSYTGTPITDPERRSSKGTFFLETDKGERHSTGSYYTPDFVVRQIVQKTVGPTVDGRLDHARIKKSSLREAILGIRVLDPAMGSGHFLVDTVDFLTPALIKAVEEDRTAGRVPATYSIATEDARRLIVSHCVYGVDLNPMAVELAKVTLWLHTLAKAKPLTFLDHHLKIGNSLLGANPRLLSKYPTKENRQRWADDVATAREKRVERRFEKAATFPPLMLDRIVGRVQEIEALRDETIDDVKQKEALYQKLRTSAEFTKIRAIADAWVAAFFGTQTSETPDGKNAVRNYNDLQRALQGSTGEAAWTRTAARANLKAITKMAKERHFFHWEFEFPEVFFEKGSLKDDAGFDVILGNPPYMNIETLYAVDPEGPAIYNEMYESAGEGRYDIYVLFVERALGLMTPVGEFGFILPNKWFKADFGRPLRALLHRRKAVKEIVDWRGYYTLFYENGKGPITYVALLFLSKTENESFRYVAFPSLTAKDSREIVRARLRESDAYTTHKTPDILVGRIETSRLADPIWSFSLGDARSLVERLKGLPHFGSEAEVFEGVTTAAVPVFYLRKAQRNPATGTVTAWSDALEKLVDVEEGSVKPLLEGKNVTRWRRLYDEDVILWPYEASVGIDGHETWKLIPESRLERKFTLAWKYLTNPIVKAILLARESGGKQDAKKDKAGPAPAEAGASKGRFAGRADWYAYSYPRSMSEFAQPKVVLPDAASQGDAAWDPTGAVIANTLYGVRPLDNAKWSIFALQALLNHDLLAFWVREMGSPLKDGFYRFMTKYVKPYPIPKIQWSTAVAERSRLAAEATNIVDSFDKDSLSTAEEWVEQRLRTGQRDVVHDVLALAAKRVNELYEVNFQETKAFLTWFEKSYLLPTARLDEFSGKTILQSFAEHPFDKIYDVMKKNKKLLAVAPRERSFFEEVQKHYLDSTTKQRPRFELAQQVQQFVEWIVTKLYEFSEEETAVVHEATARIEYR